jgi:hypothetical protein
VGAHIHSLYIEDIYFLIGLSHCGSRVTLTDNKGGRLPMNEYIWQYCIPEAERCSDKVSIRDVRDLPLQTILFTISHMVGSSSPHMAL